MVKWLLASLLDRVLVGLALFLVCVAWGGSLQQPVRQVLSITDGATSPFEKILRALE